MDENRIPRNFPPQEQTFQPGLETEMMPHPVFDNPDYRASGKLNGKVAIITGGDSGIGRAIAIAFAKEGADLFVVYKNEHVDAEETRLNVEAYGRTCLLAAGDIGDEAFCKSIAERTIRELGRIDILVNNAGEQHARVDLENVSKEQLEQTFRTNFFGMFMLTKAVLPYLETGSTIVNTASVTAYRGSPQMIDYSASKGAIIAFTRSLALSLISRKIRVNAVAPGPIWTPLVVASFASEQVAQFGQDVPMGRAGQPFEVAPCYVFLASHDASYMTGQVLHPNGGEIINSYI